MKILMLNYEYPPLGGGAGVITKYITEGLANQNNTITVVTTWYNDEKEIECFDNIKIVRLKSKRKHNYKSNVFEMYDWISKTKEYLNSLLVKESFDLTFANFSIPGGVVAKHIKEKYNIPYTIISHGHDIPWFCFKQMFKYHIITYFWIKSICKTSSLNFVQSIEMKNNIDKFLDYKYSSKNIIIPNGCDIYQFKAEKSPNTNPIFKILIVGRLVQQKDPITSLKAIKIINNKNIPFVVHILGNGPMKEKMQKFINDNNLGDKVFFKNWVDKNQMAKEYNEADLLLAPSLYEGMSIAILEALSSGLYTITTKVSGNSILIKENVNGEYIEKGDYNTLADKILDYYQNKYQSNYQIDESFLRNFQEKFDWNNITKEYNTVLKKYFE